MKKLLLLVLAALSLSFVACGGDDKAKANSVEKSKEELESPVSVAQKFIDATMAGNKEVAFNLCMESKNKEKAESDFANAVLFIKMIKSEGKTIKAGEVKVKGERALVYIDMIYDGKGENITQWMLRKVSGKWKVDLEAEYSEIESFLKELEPETSEKGSEYEYMSETSEKGSEYEYMSGTSEMESEYEVEAEMEQAQAEVEAEMKQAQAEVEAEMKQAQAEVEAEMKQAQAEVEAEMKRAQAEVEAEMKQMRP